VFLGPIQKHTGVFHNENGVFIPWKTLCSASQSYLLESCDSLINTDGTLTSAGESSRVYYEWSHNNSLCNSIQYAA
jgi:hypothetical protein